VVIDHDEPPRIQQAAEVREVEEDAVEPMVAVDEREIEPPALLEELRERELRSFGSMVDDRRYAGVFEHLEPAVRKACRLVGIEGYVTTARDAEESFADEQGAETVPQPDLDRSRRAFRANEPRQRLALRSSDRNRKDVVHRTVQTRDDRARGDHFVDDPSNA